MPLSRSKRGKAVLHRRTDGGDAPVVDHDVAGCETVGIGLEMRGICDEATGTRALARRSS